MSAVRECRDVSCYGRVWLAPSGVPTGSPGPGHGRQPPSDAARRPMKFEWLKEAGCAAEGGDVHGSRTASYVWLGPIARHNPAASCASSFVFDVASFSCVLQPPLPLPFPLLFPLTIVSPPVPPPCPSSPATLDPEPAEEIPTSNPSTKVGGREGGRDRRRAVRIVWEKLV